MRFAVRVKAGASRTAVGGRWRDDALIVAVRAKAVEGKANEAVIAALAEAFEVRRSQLAIIAGAHSRDKVIELDGDAQTTLDRLLDTASKGG